VEERVLEYLNNERPMCLLRKDVRIAKQILSLNRLSIFFDKPIRNRESY